MLSRNLSLLQANNLKGAVSLGTLFLTSLPFFRQLAYEIFLRTHQGLAGLCIYATWRHLPSQTLFPRLYLYIALGICLLTFILQFAIILYRNGAFTSRGYPRATVTYDGDSREGGKNSIIKIRVALPRPIEVHAGQYINLWMLSMGLCSWAQSHPLMVTSWSQENQSTLDLFVQPHRGLSADLLRHARAAAGGSTPFPALFSGPHGVVEPVNHYETVLMVASGFGIAAVIPYLKQLIYGYNTSMSRTRRVHFVWQLQTLGKICYPLPDGLGLHCQISQLLCSRGLTGC
jgi:predicted ferric reductase